MPAINGRRRHFVAITVPAAPTGLSGTPRDSGGTHFIDWSWSTVVDATSYEYSIDGGSNYISTGSTASVTTSGTGGATENILVRAVNAAGAGTTTSSSATYLLTLTQLTLSSANGIGSNGVFSGLTLDGDNNGGSSGGLPGHLPASAFDANTGTYWQSIETNVATLNDAWIGYDFGSAQTVGGFSIDQSGASASNEYVTSVSLYSSDDASNWTLRLNSTGSLGASQSATFNNGGANFGAHRYWHLRATSNLATTGNWRVTEVKLFRYQ